MNKSRHRERTARRIVVVALGALIALLLTVGITGPARARAAGPKPTDTPTATQTPQPTDTPTATATSTLAPTATQTPQGGSVAVAPNPFELPVDTATDNATGPHVAVTVEGLAPKEDIAVYLTMDKSGASGVILDQGTTDTHGAYRDNPQLPVSDKGTYFVLVYKRVFLGATDGSPIAQGTFTLKRVPSPPIISLGSGSKPGEYCFLAAHTGCVEFGDLWAKSTEGLAGWWQGVTKAGQASLVQAIIGVTTTVIDFTGNAFGGIFDLSKPILIWGAGLLSVLIGMRLLAEAVTMKADADGAHQAQHWTLLIVELALLLGIAGALKPIEHGLWAWTAGASGGLGTSGLKDFGDALGTWTTYRGPSLQEEANWGMGAIASLVLLLLLTAQLVLLTLGVLSSWVYKMFLWLLGALCVATGATPQTRPLALWWLRSMLSVSLWVVAWLFVFSIEGKAIGSLAKAGGINPDPKVAVNPLLALGVGIVMMLVTNAVPAAVRKGVTLGIAGGGGVLDELSGPVGSAWGWAKGKVPLLGRLP